MRIPKPARRSPKPRARLRRKRKGGLAWAGRECDRLWSLIVRASNGGRCFVATDPGCLPGHVCNGAIRAAHGFSRRYRATRWELINGFPLDAAAHVRLTHDPLAWDGLLLRWWGESVYAELRRKAVASAKVDPREVLETLRAEANRLGL